MDKKRYILIFITLVLVIGGSIFAWQEGWLTKTKQQDETANWQTYQNGGYGFEIKHPKNSQCKFSETDKGSFSFGRIELNVTDSKGLDLVDYVDNFIKNNVWTIATKENTITADTASVKVTYRFGGTNRYGEATFIENKGNIYTIGYTAGGFTCDEPQVFPQILSTFKFIGNGRIQDWESLIPDIKTTLKQIFPQVNFSDYPAKEVGIYKTEDITGDGALEALVDTSIYGANTESYILMMMEGSKTVAAKIKNKEGKISSDHLFMLGGGVSTGLTVGFLPIDNAIFEGSSQQDFTTGTHSACDVRAYKWNAVMKIFEFNEGLSNKIKTDVCSLPEMNN